MSVSTPSTACWSWDARPTSASPEPRQGWGNCARIPDPCTICGRPLPGKGKLQDCRGAWSAAAICPASGAAANPRGPVWEFADRVQITAAYSRYGGAHWLSRSRLADRCAMPSFRSPHALAAPARLRGRRRSPINAPLDQQGPDNAGRLVGQGYGDQHLRLARQHPRPPRARGCAALTGPADHRTRTEDEQTPDGPLAHLRDRAELLLAAGRFLQGRQPEPGGEVAPGPEALRRGHEGRDRGGRDRTDAWDRHQPARHGVGLRALGDLGLQRLDLRLQRPEGADQHFQDGSSALRHGGDRILDMGDTGVGGGEALGETPAVSARGR